MNDAKVGLAQQRAIPLPGPWERMTLCYKVVNAPQGNYKMQCDSSEKF